jgi:hypothetical protein
VQPEHLTAAHPVGKSQHDASSRYPAAASSSWRAWDTVSVLPSFALMRGAADKEAAFRPTMPSRTACPSARHSCTDSHDLSTPTSHATSWCASPTSDPRAWGQTSLPGTYADTHMHTYVSTFRQP